MTVPQLTANDQAPTLQRSAGGARAVITVPSRGHVRGTATTGVCPFCPPSRLAPASADHLIFPNDAPVVGPPPAGGVATSDYAYGFHDVVVPTPDHHRKLHLLTVDTVAGLLRDVGGRFAEYARAGMRHAYLFLANDERFGHSEPHPHGQLLATPFLPPAVVRLRRADGACVPCRERGHPSAPGRTFITGETTGLLPEAPRLPLEMWLIPKDHRHLSDMTGSQTRSLAATILASLRLAEVVVGAPAPYLVSVYDEIGDPDAHPYVETQHFGRPGGGEKYLGGFELSLGIDVNPSSPADVADQLRQSLDADRQGRARLPRRRQEGTSRSYERYSTSDGR